MTGNKDVSEIEFDAHTSAPLRLTIGGINCVVRVAVAGTDDGALANAGRVLDLIATIADPAP